MGGGDIRRSVKRVAGDLKREQWRVRRIGEKLEQLGKIMRGKSGSMGMMEDITKRKRDEFEEVKGGGERRKCVGYSKKAGRHRDRR